MDEEQTNVKSLWQPDILKPLLTEVMSEFGYLAIDLNEEGEPVTRAFPEHGNTVEIRSPWEGHENEGWRFRFEKPLLLRATARYLAVETDDIVDDQLYQMALEIAEVTAGRYLQRVDPDCRWPLHPPRLIDHGREKVPGEAVAFVNKGNSLAVWPEWSEG